MSYRSYQRFNLNPILAIIGVTLLVFIATTISRGLVFTLGLVPAQVASHPWTLVTNMFVHGGFGHIFGNMLTLFFFGNYLSGLVGDRRFLIVYFAGGIMGNILYILLAPPLSVAIGASGAVYAVAGALVMLRPNARVFLWFLFPMPLWAVVLLFFVLWSFFPGIAWEAHLGGLAFGLGAGYLFRRWGRYYF